MAAFLDAVSAPVAGSACMRHCDRGKSHATSLARQQQQQEADKKNAAVSWVPLLARQQVLG
jgi:hypothetical protein